MISKSVFIKKKRIMEQFSLEKYLANPSRKVVTRDGRRVRVICTDMKSTTYPVVALIENGSGYEQLTTFSKNGEYAVNESSRSDLFFAPEKHEGWVNIYKEGTNRYLEGCICVTKEEAKRIRGYGYITTIKIEWEE